MSKNAALTKAPTPFNNEDAITYFVGGGWEVCGLDILTYRRNTI